MSELKERVIEALRTSRKPLSPKEIAELTGINAKYCKGKDFFYLLREVKVKKSKKGLYEYA